MRLIVAGENGYSMCMRPWARARTRSIKIRFFFDTFSFIACLTEYYNWYSRHSIDACYQESTHTFEKVNESFDEQIKKQNYLPLVQQNLLSNPVELARSKCIFDFCGELKKCWRLCSRLPVNGFCRWMNLNKSKLISSLFHRSDTK